MTITAKVIAHSRAEHAPDLITLECRYPRMIHSEFMTHRVFSRNASSSRAIPVGKMIQSVIDDPAMPVAWGSNKPGMQAGEECHEKVGTGDYTGFSREGAWLFARNNAVDVARGFAEAGYHKQIVNRLLEPFAHITVVVTATDWDNFFDLRCHPDADPTMRALAEAMQDVIAGSKAAHADMNAGWHLPYITLQDVTQISGWMKNPEFGATHIDFLPMISAARCARVSYLNHDGSTPDIEKDMKLAEMLFTSKHMSPFEHQAKLPDPENMDTGLWGNFNGWEQHRKMIEVNQ